MIHEHKNYYATNVDIYAASLRYYSLAHLLQHQNYSWVRRNMPIEIQERTTAYCSQLVAIPQSQQLKNVLEMRIMCLCCLKDSYTPARLSQQAVICTAYMMYIRSRRLSKIQKSNSSVGTLQSRMARPLSGTALIVELKV